MPRDYEIMIAFRQAIKRDSQGRYTLSTLDFVRELDLLNWHYTLRAANKWVETHTTTFRDISTSEGEERVFQVFNPNGGF
ncbi:DNA polymerase V [Pantoea allii]|uniref:DNA polymerase V n=1 Tax=Pantoea allii TaxID=574096 RepID=A0ABS6VCR1_9GAMM|nr:DNA polymerase V [Pantoea allii]MBW1213668.1 DNA polymerase V [Pantoea allii]MBW1251941.1 DNA polymerase V [Pantoea allii]MBW1257089.1 DNA polymerase V [Pantoea allii]MBW1260538.1 DNA polymerase V [Pantoea allii]MBW1266166.1 DNA polymerase V [Pantoea allii]